MASTNPDVTMKAEGSMETKSNQAQGLTSQLEGSTHTMAGYTYNAAVDLFVLQHKTDENAGLRRQISKVVAKRCRLLEPPVLWMLESTSIVMTSISGRSLLILNLENR